MNKITLMAGLLLASVSFCGCSKDDDDTPSSSGGSIFDNSSKVQKPTIKHVSCTTTTTDFDVVYRITSSVQPSSVTLHYAVFSNKAANIKKTDCNKTSSCRMYEQAGKNNYYYKASHTGFHSGYYIYYYVTATNSGGTSESNVSYQIFKR